MTKYEGQRLKVMQKTEQVFFMPSELRQSHTDRIAEDSSGRQARVEG